jgi:hypothetical protein
MYTKKRPKLGCLISPTTGKNGEKMAEMRKKVTSRVSIGKSSELVQCNFFRVECMRGQTAVRYLVKSSYGEFAVNAKLSFLDPF